MLLGTFLYMPFGEPTHVFILGVYQEQELLVMEYVYFNIFDTVKHSLQVLHQFTLSAV